MGQVALHYFAQIIAGVAYCHSKGVCHRDLKLENLLLDASRQYVKITDFGWAHDQTILGRSQSFAGTASGCYMAPEVRSRHNKARGQGASYDGTKADVWSCGVVLYKLLCVRDPFDWGLGLDEEEEEQTVHDPASLGVTFSPSLASLFCSDEPSLLSRDPTVRLSAVQAMYQPWLREGTTTLRASLGQLSPCLNPTSPGPPKMGPPKLGVLGAAAALAAAAASKAPTSPGPPVFSKVQVQIPPLSLAGNKGPSSPEEETQTSIGAPATGLGLGGGFWAPEADKEDDDEADYGGFYFDQRAAREFKAKSDAKSQASQVQWQYERGPVGGTGTKASASGVQDTGGTRDGPDSRASSVGSSVGMPYESWGGNDSWGASSVESQEEKPTPTSVLKTAGSNKQAAVGGTKKTARFSEIVAVKEVVYETGDNFGDPFLGDSLGGSALPVGEREKVHMRQYPHPHGHQARLQAEQGSAAAVRQESSARWAEMESDASGIWRFAQLRAERWRAEDDARRLRTEVKRLRWQLDLCRVAMEETAAALDKHDRQLPVTCGDTLQEGAETTPNKVAAVKRELNHKATSQKTPSAEKRDRETREREPREMPQGSSAAVFGDVRSPRAAAAAAAAARGILDQTARTPWLRTPDGVPVRIDWPVLAPRVLAALGVWLGATAIVMRTTRQSRNW